MTKTFRNLVKGAVRADKVTFRKDGTVEFRRSYFYHHGATAEGFARRISLELTEAGFAPTLVEARDDWAAWPKTSYFVAAFQVAFRSAQGQPVADL
jgi:hypothetical protein